MHPYNFIELLQGYCITIKTVSFSDEDIFYFVAMNSSKWLQWFHGFVEYSWLIKSERHLMALRTNDSFWNSIPIIKQSLIFCFLKELCICWHRYFSFLWTSSIIIIIIIIIIRCALHRRVDDLKWRYQPLRTHQEKYKIIKSHHFSGSLNIFKNIVIKYQWYILLIKDMSSRLNQSKERQFS